MLHGKFRNGKLNAQKVRNFPQIDANFDLRTTESYKTVQNAKLKARFMTDLTPLIPRQTVPSLSLPLVGGGNWSLEKDQPESFTLLIFYRGWHCPICRSQLQDAQSRMFDFQKRGVKLVAISTDDESRATSTKESWGLDKLSIAYGLSLRQAREWGLYLSTFRGTTSLGVEEPAKFNEPGLFLIKPDNTLYYVSVQSSPFARPSLSDLTKAVDFVLANDYPARGELMSAT